MVRLPASIEAIPDREGNPEEALPADAPIELQVLHPVAIAQAHEFGMPADLVAMGQELGLLVEQPHEPLPGRQ